MANVPLKSITFPGLSDTYTVPQIDNTLTTSGKAADAKVTGDQLNDLKSAKGNVISYTTVDGYLLTNGNVNASDAYIEATTDFIPCEAGNSIIFQADWNGYSKSQWNAYCLYDKEKALISSVGRVVFGNTTTDKLTYTISISNTSAKYIRICWRVQTTGVTVGLYGAGLYDTETKANLLSARNKVQTVELTGTELSVNKLGYYPFASAWEMGNLANDGTDADNYADSRMRTDYIDVSGYNWFTYKISNYLRMYIDLFDSEKTLLSAAGWKTNETATVDISGAAYVRLLITRLSDNYTPYINSDTVMDNFSGTFSTATTKKDRVPEFHSLFLPANSSRYIFGKGKMWEEYWNTQEAFEAAGKDERCWGIDGDCQYTNDNELVMWHDTTITYDGDSVAVSTLDLDEIETITITDNGKTYSVCAFDDFVEICRKYGKVCNIELKGQSAGWSWVTNSKSAMIDKIIGKLYDLGMQHSTFIDAMPSDIAYIRGKYPDIACARLFDANVTQENIASYINDPQIIPAGYAANWTSNDTMKVAHAAGQKTMVYGTRPQTKSDIDAMKLVNADVIAIYVDPDE